MSGESVLRRQSKGRSRWWKAPAHLDERARAELGRFMDGFRKIAGSDLTHYKPVQVYERARARAQRFRLTDLDDYCRLLEGSPQERAAFLDSLTPNVSEFFRDPSCWAWLAEHVLPGLLGAGRALKLWSAGCASGAEAYSLAMLLEDLSPGVPHFLLATDVDRQVLNCAAEGIYCSHDLRYVPRQYRDWLLPCEEGLAVAPGIRRRVTFAPHDLLADPFEEDFDFIACRNVLIYFSDDAKNRIYERFSAALALGGVLFLGLAERLRDPSAFGFVELHPGFYQRTE
ncbi:MAG: CheR family methyltransferase [Chthonomonadales bacterium]